MICIEVAHIYANHEVSQEHFDSIVIARKLKKSNNHYRFLCLIDNYHAEGNINEIKSQLKNIQKNITFYYEKDLIVLAQEFVSKLTLTEKTFKNKKVYFLGDISLFEIKNDETIFYCATLCSVWYLFRLGYFNQEKIEKIINILPLKYESNEKKVIQILSLTQYKDSIKKIEYIWH